MSFLSCGVSNQWPRGATDIVGEFKTLEKYGGRKSFALASSFFELFVVEIGTTLCYNIYVLIRFACRYYIYPFA